LNPISGSKTIQFKLKMAKKLLWLDDCRNPQENDWLVFSPIGKDVDVKWVLSYDGFVKWITANGLPDAICFDHDLGDDIANDLVKNGMNKKKAREVKRQEKTGYDCAKWLIDYCQENELEIPTYAIQSANPVGKENIDKLLKNYINFMKQK